MEPTAVTAETEVPFVVTFEAAASLSRRAVGGKGASLAELDARGLGAVPPGFIVTTAAFEASVGRPDLPDAVRSAIESALRALSARNGGAALAVRSSAIDEDSADASFAGQYETILDVRSSRDVLSAVRTCWASLARPEALEYRADKAGKAGTGAMAVVVQTMVRAEASGVAFTCDPVHGDSGSVVIDVVAGLGDALVSGAKTPDHYVLAKADLGIVRRELAAGHAVLCDERVREVAALAVRIEAELGAPQDVEWSIGDGALWLLQSRPVTTLDRAAAGARSELDTATAPDTEWTSMNVQEVLPGLLSPLTQSIVLRDFDAYSREALRRLGLRPRTKEPMVGVFYGRAFLNLSLAQEIGGQTAESEKHYLGAEEQARRKKSGGTLAKLRLALALPKTIWCLSRLSRGLARLEALAKQPIDERSPDALRAFIAEHGAMHVLVSIYSGAMFTILGKLTEKWLGDSNGALHARLLQGLAEMDSAKPAYELWELAELAARTPSLRDIVTRADPQALAAARDDVARVFRGRLDAFLRDHGHHSVQEMELAARTWDEDLETVLALTRNYLDAERSRSPSAIEERARADRESATSAALTRLGAWQRPLFRYFLRAAQRWVPLRERSKSLLIRAMHKRRRFLRDLGRALRERDLVRDASDIHYLTWQELHDLDEGKVERDVAAGAIRRRRIEERRNRLVALPERFAGPPAPAPASLEPVSAPADRTLTGIAVSRGIVTGRARVILDPSVDSVIHPGEILVAPITDAGWTPLFTVAAGLVVDIGGALSHGSTVAREYGLPAVVNVKIATRLIRTGDTITVDGTRGVVELGAVASAASAHRLRKGT